MTNQLSTPSPSHALCQVRVLLTKRASTLTSHAGEVSFPGGRVDPTDETETAAALREAHEYAAVPTLTPGPLISTFSLLCAKHSPVPVRRRMRGPAFIVCLCRGHLCNVFILPACLHVRWVPREVGLDPSDVSVIALFPYAVAKVRFAGGASLARVPILAARYPPTQPAPPHLTTTLSSSAL